MVLAQEEGEEFFSAVVVRRSVKIEGTYVDAKDAWTGKLDQTTGVVVSGAVGTAGKHGAAVELQ